MTWAVVIAILIIFTVEITSGMPITNVSPQDIPKLEALGAITPDTIALAQYWRFLTAMFLHIGLLHLVLNTWALYQLGGVFEMMFGSPRFLFIYFATGVIASASSAIFTHSTSAGASGAIFGILGALIVSIRRSSKWRRQPWTRGLTHQLIFWAAVNIFIVSRIPGIDNAAHIGGLVSGMALGLIPHHEPPPPPSRIVLETTRDGETVYRVD